MTGGSLIDEIVRDGARRMLAAALEAEVAAYIDAHADQVDERGRRLVVRNGRAAPRQVVTAAGAVEVTGPRVNDKRVDEATGERRRFSSAILAPWCRRSPTVSEVLPLLYLHGLSSGDFVPALGQSRLLPIGSRSLLRGEPRATYRADDWTRLQERTWPSAARDAAPPPGD